MDTRSAQIEMDIVLAVIFCAFGAYSVWYVRCVAERFRAAWLERASRYTGNSNYDAMMRRYYTYWAAHVPINARIAVVSFFAVGLFFAFLAVRGAFGGDPNP